MSAAGAAGSFLRRLVRENPWWSAAVAGVLLLAGTWWGREALARARLRRNLEAWLAEHPAPPPPAPVAEGENAADLYFEALRLLGPGTSSNAMAGPATAATVPPALVQVVEANGESLALVERAAALPRCVPPAGQAPPGQFMDLSMLAFARGRVLAAAGDRAGAVRSFLLVHRMVRQTGRVESGDLWISPASALGTVGPLLDLLEEPGGLDRESLEAILRDALTPEEAREWRGRRFEDWRERAAAERFLDLLLPGAEDRARAKGWRPPTLAQRLQQAVGMPLPRGVEPFPTAVAVEEWWEETLRSAGLRGVRGPGAFPLVRTTPSEYRAGRDAAEEVRRMDLREVRMAFCEETWFSLLRGAAAVRLFDAVEGRPPERLEELVPRFLAAVPEDTFTGGTLRWKPGEKEGVLESGGPPPGDGGMDITRPMGREAVPRARLRRRER